jgi:hypothetical protein
MLSGAFSFHQAKGEKSPEAKPPKVIVREATSRAGRATIHQPLPQIAAPFGLQLVHLCSSRRTDRASVAASAQGDAATTPAPCTPRPRAGPGSGAASSRVASTSGRGRARPGIRRPRTRRDGAVTRPAECCGFRSARRLATAAPAAQVRRAASESRLRRDRSFTSGLPSGRPHPDADRPVIFGTPAATRARSRRAERSPPRTSGGGRRLRRPPEVPSHQSTLAMPWSRQHRPTLSRL